MALPLFQVDAFAEAPFTGNPAAVVLLDRPAPEDWMQRVAEEMNLSETAFVRPRAETQEHELRWFTPAAEVELCGHATLASAHVLWETGQLAGDEPADFVTRFSGRLRCRLGPDGWIRMDFPADPAREEPPPPGLCGTLGVRPSRTARSRYDWLVEVGSEADVTGAEPDFSGLAVFETRGVILTARSARDGVDFVSRFFAPRLRVREDPVTGSAHCVLGPWWADRLGRSDLVGFQASSRGGTVQVGCRGDRVELGGRAVTVARGSLVASLPD